MLLRRRDPSPFIGPLQRCIVRWIYRVLFYFYNFRHKTHSIQVLRTLRKFLFVECLFLTTVVIVLVPQTTKIFKAIFVQGSLGSGASNRRTGVERVVPITSYSRSLLRFAVVSLAEILSKPQPNSTVVQQPRKDTKTLKRALPVV